MFKPGDIVRLKDQMSYSGCYTGDMRVLQVTAWVLCEHLTSNRGVTLYRDELELAPTTQYGNGLQQLHAIFDELTDAAYANYFVLDKKCECGAESLGYNTHSHWCQKHEK